MAGTKFTPLDLYRFHRLERDFYHKLIHQLNLNPERTKWVMSLWLWFESIGHHDFIRHVSAYEDDVIVRFVAEGNACLDRLIGSENERSGGGSDELPLTTTLVTEPMDLHFFDYHKDVAIVRVNHFYNNVANVIFDDDLMEVVARNADHPAIRRIMSSGLHINNNVNVRPQPMPHGNIITPSFGEGSSRQGAQFGAAMAEPFAVQSRLNPMAEPWSPAMNQSPEDLRSMFITFSRGYPITREDIMDFFNERYGMCVELVMIERANGGSPPMYGRVVFTSASMIATVLNGQQTAKFIIKGKHLWARIYVPRT